MHRRYAAVVAGDYASAGVLPPVSGPSVYARAARAATDRHGCDPLSDPERLVVLDSLAIVWGWTPGRHGIHYDDTVIVSPCADPLESKLCVHHEWAHSILRRYGAPHHTEADVIWLTIELALPSFVRERWESAEFVPTWLKNLRASARRR